MASVKLGLLATDVLQLLDDEEKALLSAALGLQIEPGKDIAVLLGSYDAQFLLIKVVQLRTPFIKMMHQICSLLDDIEASAPGNIRYIILPDAESALRFDFGPQLRRALATIVNANLLASSDLSIDRLLAELQISTRTLLEHLRPERIGRDNALGRSLRRSPDPEDRMARRLLRPMTKRPVSEFSERDAEEIEALHKQFVSLSELSTRLASDRPTPLPLSEAGQAIAQLTREVESKLHEVSDSVSTEHPFAKQSVPSEQYHACSTMGDRLRTALLSAAEFKAAEGEVFDFLNLELWRHRWRIYELWLLERTINALRSQGAVITDSRIRNGRWSLKFTKDTEPILSLSFRDMVLDCYYQYYRKGQSGGAMPDIAVSERNGAFVAVLDPKHGKSYRESELAKVCLAYAEAFTPKLSCVINYFHETGTPERRVAETPLCLVLQGLTPGTTAEAVLFSAVRRALLSTIMDKGSAGLSVVALLDVSSSTAGIRPKLLESFRLALHENRLLVSEFSRALLFSDGIVAQGTLPDLASGALDTNISGGGTDLMCALTEAVGQLADLPEPRELWVFSDGQGAYGPSDVMDRMRALGIRLRVWEYGGDKSVSQLRTLSSQVGGEFHLILSDAGIP